MAKFMYWLWGVAEDREFRGGLLAPFWGWLTLKCDRYHGYRHDAQGHIVSNVDAQGPKPDRPYPFGNEPFI